MTLVKDKDHKVDFIQEGTIAIVTRTTAMGFFSRRERLGSTPNTTRKRGSS